MKIQRTISLYIKCLSILSLILSFRMDRPSKISFLDSDGTTAFEYRVPKVQSDMVRHHTNIKSWQLASVGVFFRYVCLCVSLEREKLRTGMKNALTVCFFSHNSFCYNKH